MSHCPQCGETTPEGARACPFCGSLLAAAPRAPAPASRTIVGVSVREVAARQAQAQLTAGEPSVAAAPPGLPAPVPGAPPAGASKASRTIVGMPSSALAGVLPKGVPQTPGPPVGAPANHESTARSGPAGAQENANRPAPSPAGRTIVGMAAGALGNRASHGNDASAAHAAAAGPGAMPAPLAGAPRAKASATLLGVALPGIAPLAPGQADGERAERDEGPGPRPVAPTPGDLPGYEAARELGATMGPSALNEAAIERVRDHDRERRRRRAIVGQAARPLAKPARREDDRTSRRALAIVFTAGGLALAAVLVALFWPSAPPLKARARLDAGGREGVELDCKSCPDGTKLTIDGVSAVTAGGVALVAIPSPLSVGENRLKVAIDRPGNGRDETVSVNVNVGYRIRPDLATLQADRPAFQIVAEVAAGTTVTIDGRKMALVGGRGVENVDVADVCSGLTASAGEVKTLSRQVPYVVTPQDGPPEQGVVNVSVGVVPLHLDAPVALASPTPHVVIDGPSFVLAGGTMKGAEVLAAGRPITVHADGTFAQVMNVSTVGATQIEVRAKMPGMAPRFTQIKVRRVDSLEKAAHELVSAEPTLPFAQLVANVPAAVGKAVAFIGEVSDVKKQSYETIMLLEVSAASGCPAGSESCTVRLVQGADNAAKRGDTLRVFGHVAGGVPGAGKKQIPEIEVDFTLKGSGGAASDFGDRR